MSESYFSFPVYVDKTHEVELKGSSSETSVFVFVKKHDFSPENEALLRKILKAIKLDFDTEVKAFLLEEGQDVFVFENFNPSGDVHFLAFGLNAKRLGIQTRTIPYKWMRFDKLSILFSHSLADLQKNVENKKKLWALLQQFGTNG